VKAASTVNRESLIEDTSLARLGGPHRPSAAPISLTALVISGDRERRDKWAAYFEDFGLRTMRCAGPKVTPCLSILGGRCPLHNLADIILYDEESVTPDLEEQFRTLRPSAPIAYARSQRAESGEFPVTTRIFSRGR
jgi:hypothetical protein